MSLKKMVATKKKKASDRKEQIRVLNGVEESISKKINRLKELNINRSSDQRQQEDDSMMDVICILSDGRVGVVSMDVDGGVLFNSNLDEGIIHQPADARVRHNDVQLDSEGSSNTTMSKRKQRRRPKKKKVVPVLDRKYGVWVPKRCW
jgi:hypothetical protein